MLWSGDSCNFLQERWCLVSINLSGSGLTVERWEATHCCRVSCCVAAGEPQASQVFNVRQKAKTLIILRRDVNIMFFITVWVRVQVISGFLRKRWMTDFFSASQGIFKVFFVWRILSPPLSPSLSLWHVFHCRLSVSQRYLFLTPCVWFRLVISSRLLSPWALLGEGER